MGLRPGTKLDGAQGKQLIGASRSRRTSHPEEKDAAVSGSSGSSNAGGSSSSKYLLVGGVVAFLAVAYFLRSELDINARIKELEEVVSQAGSLGPIIFGGTYAASTVLLFPASVLTLGAGYLFGPGLGTVVVSAAATTGASLSFLISRYLARPLVEQWVAGNKSFTNVDKNIANEGAKIVLLLRLSPLVPFNLLNYGLGITQVKFPEYVVASWAGMLPGTFAYVYLGSLGRIAVDATAGGDGSQGTADLVKYVLYGVGGIATILATRLISQAASKALEDQTPDSSDDVLS